MVRGAPCVTITGQSGIGKTQVRCGKGKGSLGLLPTLLTALPPMMCRVFLAVERID